MSTGSDRGPLAGEVESQCGEGGRRAHARGRSERVAATHPHTCVTQAAARRHMASPPAPPAREFLDDVDMDEEKASVGLDWDR